jgi:hypothetical protein
MRQLARKKGERQMKRCPTCQRTFPDNAPDACPYDGTFVVSEGAQQQQYYPGAQPPPYGAPPAGGDPSQWQQQQQGGYYQQPGGQYPPPYGNPYAPASGGGGLSKAALFTGIAAIAVFAVGFILAIVGINNLDYSMLQLAGVIILLSLVAGLAAVILGIVTLVMAGKNPALSKAQGVIGLILGAIPLILWLIGLARRGGGF